MGRNKMVNILFLIVLLIIIFDLILIAGANKNDKGGN